MGRGKREYFANIMSAQQQHISQSRLESLLSKWRTMVAQIKVDVDEDRENGFYIAAQSGEVTIMLLEGCIKDLEGAMLAQECDNEHVARVEEDKREESAERMVSVQSITDKENT